MEKLPLSDHCQLCENLKFSFEDGTLCGLTDKKPDFPGKCRKIRFGKQVEVQIKTVLHPIAVFDELKPIRRNRNSRMVLVAFAMTFGGLFGLFGILMFSWLATGFAVTSGSGLIMFTLYVRQLKKDQSKKARLMKKKEQLDQLLDLYGIDYTFEPIFPSGWVEGEVMSSKVELKRSKFT